MLYEVITMRGITIAALYGPVIEASREVKNGFPVCSLNHPSHIGCNTCTTSQYAKVNGFQVSKKGSISPN